MTEARTRFDQRLAALGPDVLAPEFDRERFLRGCARTTRRAARRRAARPAQRRRHRQHLEGGGVLGGGHRPVAPGRRGLGCRGRGDHRRDAAANAALGAAMALGRSRPGCMGTKGGRARGAAPRSRRAARATRTARPTGAAGARNNAPAAPGRAQGRRSDRAGQHVCQFRRCSGGRRRHDRVRRAARGAGRRPHPRARLRGRGRARDAAHAGGGAGLLLLGAVRGNRSGRRPQAARIRAARARGAPRQRRARAGIDLHPVSREPRAASRRRAGDQARVVGAEADPRSVSLAGHAGAGVSGAPGDARDAAGAGGRARSGRAGAMR